VRYLVNTHFHWDHTQGNSAYKAAGAKLDIVASDTTKRLMTELSRNRLKESLDGVPAMIDGLRARLAKATSDSDKAFCREQIRQLEAYRTELKSYSLELPTITFSKEYVLKDGGSDLHIQFHGRAHTSGDIVVFSPQQRVVAAGDMISGFLPNINDGYPKPWSGTIDSVGRLAFDQIIAGHGPVHRDKARMTQLRNYIEELTGRVEEGKKAGKPVAELQKTLTLSSLKSLQANGYSGYVRDNLAKFTVYLGQRTAIEDRLAGNVEAIYNNLDRV
jgi:glyoxylase-like metal-dependent hydrolase (beta-lactamase superfamily II)